MPSYAKWPHSGLDKFDDGPIKLGDFPLPAGCDQQGRYATRQPEAAHAASECTDDLPGDGSQVRLGACIVAVVALATLCLIVMAVR